MERKIFLYMCTLTLVTFLLASILILWGFNSYFSQQMQDRVREEARIIARSLEASHDREKLLDSFHLEDSSRLTLVSPGGKVVFDSSADPRKMENHMHRREIAMALRSGTGEAVRISSTLGEKTFYYAIRLEDGWVIRMAASTSSVYTILAGIFPDLFLVAAIVFILCALLAYRLTQNILEPIYSIDMEHPQDSHGYDELAPLLLRLNEQKRLIKMQIETLATERDTINTIIGNMREGMVLLDRESRILSVNQSATKILGAAGEDCQGKSFWVLTRDLTLANAIAHALQGTHYDGLISIGEKHYHFFASPVYDKGTVNGAILLLLDITDVHRAERLRQEFSANVSHELKTPLTSISGYAEMIESGMAKEQDVKGFAGRIKREAQGLVALINDIIKLSRLDEAEGELSFEPVNLLSAAKVAVKRLQPQATEKQVTVFVEGEEATICGDEIMLQELIYNLCENAIKYNKPGGTVHINVSREENNTLLSVTDTGIGIPKEHRDRVFERFYRADKSHSKKIAGTGLGLAIVKHIAQYHGAKINLESRENEGTRITVIFS